jgi:single stranded DNA-binding protein
MNKVTLIGRLTKDPELQERSGKQVCDMRLAVNGPGNVAPLLIAVVAFGDTATESATHSKGDQVEIEGSLRYSEWEAKSSPKSKKTQKRSKHSVIVRELAAA